VRCKLRKFQQEQVLELIKTINEAHSEFIKLHSEHNISMFVALLADCQECAIQVGNYIESIEGEGTTTVSLLEEYCEILYFASVEADSGGDYASFFERLEDQLTEIRSSVENELRQNKIEIAFFPYKASMWDSCESVWLAAQNDPECDAYVVPIPYFDRMPDGTVGQMHYEGDQYPDYVPVVDWRHYNVEERRPDVIVTINAYDERNFVTMVHPDYFSQRLKNLTDLLVYIPYFVSLDDVEEHFCVAQGVLNADRVIVQSDKIRKTYIRVLKQLEQDNQCVGRFGNLEEKIVALGSPKFDKVLNTKREDCSIPDEWRELIERPDGTRKKIVLYNTSIASLLEGNKKVLNKLRDVFDCFAKRDDVVLLWRPHPLNQSTYQSMRPQLLEEYEHIVQQYKKQQVGIYDDTTDLNRAIAISDAYYGDLGSLVALYACTGKPIRVQLVEQLSVMGESVRADTFFDDGQYLWVPSSEFNELFRVDKQTMIAEYIGGFAEEYAQHLYLDIMGHGTKLYFAPFNADHIGIYDKSKHVFEKLPLQHKEKLSWLRADSNGYFIKVLQYKQYLFFVAYTYPAIVRYDTESGEMIYCSGWLSHVERAAKQSRHWPNRNQTLDFEGLLRPGTVAVGSEIVLNLFVSNELMFFNMENLTYQFYKIGEPDERYFGVCYDGEHYWVAARTGNYIVKWKRETQSYEKIEFPDYVRVGDSINYQALIYANGYVWLIPHQASAALKINVRSHSVYKANEFDSPVVGESINYMSVIQSGDMAYALANNFVLKWDMKKQRYQFHQFIISEEHGDIVKQHRLMTLGKQSTRVKSIGDMMHNDMHVGLDTFLNYVVQFNNLPFAQLQSEKQIELSSQLASIMGGKSGEAILELIKQNFYAVAGGK